MPMFRGTCIFFVLSLVPLSSAAEGCDNLTPGGPLPIRNARPFNLLFLQFQPESAAVLPSGRRALGAQLDVINNLLAPARQGGAAVVEDNEYQRLTLSFRRGFARNSELGIYLPILWRNGGFMDGLISAWHHFLGMGTNATRYDPRGRESRERFAGTLMLTDARGSVVLRGANAFGIGDVSATLKRALLQNGRSALSVRAGLKLPTGNSGLYLSSGGVDSGLMLDGRHTAFRGVDLHGSVGRVWTGSTDRALNARREIWQYLAAIVIRLNGKDSYVVQLDGSDSPIHTGNRVADRHHTTLTFGYQRLVGPSTLLYASFSENGDMIGHHYDSPYVGTVGPDFTFTMGMRWIK